MKNTFILFIALFGMFSVALGQSVKQKGLPIKGVFVDISKIRHDEKSNGDTWDHIWADDDNIYTFGCDGVGYGKIDNNLNFNKLEGNRWDSLNGSIVNPMSEYGKKGAYLGDSGIVLKDRIWSQIPNGPNWKVTGADCIDGVFYAFVAQNWYGDQKAYGGMEKDPFQRQTVNNMSLIKSTDKGLNWERTMVDNVRAPLWKSPRFSTAFFFKYGKDGGQTHQDDQHKYVYAISNDGYWNCGSAFYLGRVPRKKIGRLDAADWQYYNSGKWTADLNKATQIEGLPNGQKQCTMGSPVWLPSLKRYVAVTWYDPCDYKTFYYPDDVTFAFYQSEHPWGPWSFIGSKSAMEFIGDKGKKKIYRWYGPSLSPKFIEARADSSVTVVMMFSGQSFENIPSSLYKNNSCPVTFYAGTLPVLKETVNDAAAVYSPDWKLETKRGVGDLGDDVHVTDKPGGDCQFSFTGEGIEVLSEKYKDLGEIEVFLDGKTEGRYGLYQNPMPRLYQVPVYRKMDLLPGKHTIKIVNRSVDGVPCMVDGFKVYGNVQGTSNR